MEGHREESTNRLWFITGSSSLCSPLTLCCILSSRNFSFFIKTSIKKLGFNHFGGGSSFPYKGSCIILRLRWNKFVCFAPINLSLSVYSSDLARDPKRVKENIFLPVVTWLSKDIVAFIVGITMILLGLDSGKCTSKMIYFRSRNLALAAGWLGLIRHKCLWLRR